MSLCKTCGSPILWTRTPTGKKMPLDPDLTMEGDIILVEAPDTGDVVAVHRSKAAEYIGTDPDAAAEVALTPGRTSHFATYPQAAAHRRAR